MAKVKSGGDKPFSPKSVTERSKDDFPGGDVNKGDGLSKGGKTGVGGAPSMSQFNERSKADFPGGKVDTGTGYCK